MPDQQFATATGATPLQPPTPPTATSRTTTESPAATPHSPTPLSTLSKEFTTLELELAHHENNLYNIQTTLATLFPVTQQTTLNILSSIENAAEDLWSLKQQYERANVALLRLRLDDIRPNSRSNSNVDHGNNDEELDQMKKVSEMISKSLKWAEEFRIELGRRTDAVYFAAGDLEGIEVGDGDGELEVVRDGRGGLGVVCGDGAAAVGRFVGRLWDNETADSWDADEGLWDAGENTANMV
ncbi:hypothetical protein C7212DRAFT_360853 [Tuber magnatum]|uniref:Uncharacterized protein n=1 Tax=Tuber magnatum TaxID=42249 RepID=A0A317SWE9_9PEZI|nr:hypothetical protein C7212DRAFT_360853 [Tuber magnatum]